MKYKGYKVPGTGTIQAYETLTSAVFHEMQVTIE
jgi:hypothetical protein